MENWRRFLNESVDRDKLCLFVYSGKKTAKRLILYNIVDPSAENLKKYDFGSALEIVSGISISHTEDFGFPCVPQTYQVDTVATAEKYERQGFQKLMMDFAFLVADMFRSGLTSDHIVGTKKGAARAWNKIEDTFDKNGKDIQPGTSSEYEVQKTPEGNYKFDYDQETPDPDDDCNGGYGRESLATDYSFRKKDAMSVKPLMDKMRKNHEDFERLLASQNEDGERALQILRKILVNMEDDNFSNMYMDADDE